MVPSSLPNIALPYDKKLALLSKYESLIYLCPIFEATLRCPTDFLASTMVWVRVMVVLVDNANLLLLGNHRLYVCFYCKKNIFAFSKYLVNVYAITMFRVVVHFQLLVFPYAFLMYLLQMCSMMRHRIYVMMYEFCVLPMFSLIPYPRERVVDVLCEEMFLLDPCVLLNIYEVVIMTCPSHLLCSC